MERSGGLSARMAALGAMAWRKSRRAAVGASVEHVQSNAASSRNLQVKESRAQVVETEPGNERKKRITPQICDIVVYACRICSLR